MEPYIANTRCDNHREHVYRCVVSSAKRSAGRVVPFFETTPLRTAKRRTSSSSLESSR